MTCLAVVLTLAGCLGGFARVDDDTAKYIASLAAEGETGSVQTHYRVGPEDVLEVRVWGDEGLSRAVAVRPDGIITLPLIGDVTASGRNAKDIAIEIQKRLREFKSSPQVDVNLSQINSYRLYLLGEVNKPGMVQVRNFTTLLQAIALAGGPTRYSSNEILVMRRDAGTDTERVLHLDYRLLSSDRPEHRAYNLILLPGDTVVLR